MATLTCFYLYKDEHLVPLYSSKNCTIKDTIINGSFCACNVSQNVLYYGQESYVCPDELLLYAIRHGDAMSTIEYHTKHQDILAEKYPDAPVILSVDAVPDRFKTPGMKRLVDLGVKIQ